MLGQPNASRRHPECSNPGSALFFDREDFGSHGEDNLVFLTGVLPVGDLQRPLDGLGLYRDRETGGATLLTSTEILLILILLLLLAEHAPQILSSSRSKAAGGVGGIGQRDDSSLDL
jgi:hypothetical protein